MKKQHEEKPILFSGPMVRAILEGRKNQTRRIMKPQPVQTLPRTERGKMKRATPDGEDWDVHYPQGWRWKNHFVAGDESRFKENLTNDIKCPYGFAPSHDRLWVRETWAHESVGPDEYPITAYRADGSSHYTSGASFSPRMDNDYVPRKWKPSIFMPRWACRLMLDVVRVRVERLQDISEVDSIAEGIERYCEDPINPIDAYRVLWDSLNANRGFGWDVNPWVWVVEFKKSAQ